MENNPRRIFKKTSAGKDAMCLAIPGKVVEIDKQAGMAVVDYEAEKRDVGTALMPDLKKGDYVLVQAKMIVQVVPEHEAQDALAAIKEAGDKDA